MKKLGQISYLSSIYKYPRVSLKIRPGCDLFGIEKITLGGNQTLQLTLDMIASSRLV